jgi:hypothetical protein
MFPFVRRRSTSSARAIPTTKNPARKKISGRFRVEFTGRPTKCCSNHTDNLPFRIKYRASRLDVPSKFCRHQFCQLFGFLYRKAERFCRNEMNDEFYFATAKQIYRIMVSPQAKTFTLLDRLNAAHSNLDIDSLWWPVMSGVAAFA